MKNLLGLVTLVLVVTTLLQAREISREKRQQPEKLLRQISETIGQLLPRQEADQVLRQISETINQLSEGKPDP